MIYLILFISECLTKLAPTPTRPSPAYQEALKQLSTLAVDSFALPGDAGFPMNNMYHAPGSRQDAGMFVFALCLYFGCCCLLLSGIALKMADIRLADGTAG